MQTKLISIPMTSPLLRHMTPFRQRLPGSNQSYRSKPRKMFDTKPQLMMGMTTEAGTPCVHPQRPAPASLKPKVLHLDEMNFLRNRLVVLGLVLLATLLLYLLLPSIRQGSMEPSLEAQRMGLLATSPPALSAINVSIRTGQLPGDPPLFFREALPIDGAGRQILPRLQVVLLHGQAFTSQTWEELGTMALLATNGYQALAMDLPGYGKSPDSDALKTDQSRVDLLSRFMESLGVRAAVLLSPSMSGHYSIPFLVKNSAQLRGFIPIAPVGTRSYSPEQYQNIQTPTLIVFGALDTNLGAQSHKNLLQLPNHYVLKLEGARHACYKDKPLEFHQGLIEFLNKLK